MGLHSFLRSQCMNRSSVLCSVLIPIVPVADLFVLVFSEMYIVFSAFGPKYRESARWSEAV